MVGGFWTRVDTSRGLAPMTRPCPHSRTRASRMLHPTPRVPPTELGGTGAAVFLGGRKLARMSATHHSLNDGASPLEGWFVWGFRFMAWADVCFLLPSTVEVSKPMVAGSSSSWTLVGFGCSAVAYSWFFRLHGSLHLPSRPHRLVLAGAQSFVVLPMPPPRSPSRMDRGEHLRAPVRRDACCQGFPGPHAHWANRSQGNRHGVLQQRSSRPWYQSQAS